MRQDFMFIADYGRSMAQSVSGPWTAAAGIYAAH